MTERRTVDSADVLLALVALPAAATLAAGLLLADASSPLAAYLALALGGPALVTLVVELARRRAMSWAAGLAAASAAVALALQYAVWSGVS